MPYADNLYIVRINFNYGLTTSAFLRLLAQTENGFKQRHSPKFMYALSNPVKQLNLVFAYTAISIIKTSFDALCRVRALLVQPAIICLRFFFRFGKYLKDFCELTDSLFILAYRGLSDKTFFTVFISRSQALLSVFITLSRLKYSLCTVHWTRFLSSAKHTMLTMGFYPNFHQGFI